MGFQRLGSGVMHTVYEKDSIAYKLVRPGKVILNTRAHFEHEKDCMHKLYNMGVSVAHIYDIVEPDCIIPYYYLLKEEKCTGILYTWENLPISRRNSIFQFISSLTNQIGNSFGRIIDDATHYDGWIDYLLNKIQGYEDLRDEYGFFIEKDKLVALGYKYVVYDGPPRLLLMDFSPMNFFFDNVGHIIKIIDIDQRHIWGSIVSNCRLVCF